ncbi:MAG TPA: SDR family NAD(P)-dependent oxidoreductase [Gemmatimonadales bacterium]|nr:SDR family NAD(P)-dependent oxidoreductase [Gemmatimonadales bacterium]
MLDLSHQRVLITGGSRGIGRACARLFAQAGADVALTYHTRKDEADRAVAEVEGLGRKALSFGGDLGDAATVERLFEGLREAWGTLDVAVVNHGIWPESDVPVKAMDDARWHGTIRANLDSLFYVTRMALRLMAPGGSVILVASTAGQRGEAYHADYAATKGAVISFTKSLAGECAPDVRVNCVAPGWVDTEMSAAALRGPARARIDRTIPMGRPATAEEIAGPILFLASPLAAQITGEILNVNGGSVLCG